MSTLRYVVYSEKVGRDTVWVVRHVTDSGFIHARYSNLNDALHSIYVLEGQAE